MSRHLSFGQELLIIMALTAIAMILLLLHKIIPNVFSTPSLIGIGVIVINAVLVFILFLIFIFYAFKNGNFTPSPKDVLIALFGSALFSVIPSIMILEVYTDLFGKHHAPVMVKITDAYVKKGRGIVYRHIITQEFGNWTVSQKFYDRVNMGDLLEVQPKESIFLTTAIYENDIKIIKKSQ